MVYPRIQRNRQFGNTGGIFFSYKLLYYNISIFNFFRFVSSLALIWGFSEKDVWKRSILVPDLPLDAFL